MQIIEFFKKTKNFRRERRLVISGLNNLRQNRRILQDDFRKIRRSLNKWPIAPWADKARSAAMVSARYLVATRSDKIAEPNPHKPKLAVVSKDTAPTR